MNRITTRCVCFALFVLPATAQSVLVVDPNGGPGVGFSVLQTAINAAEEGDVILLRDGEYPGDFLIDGKSLTVVGEPGARPLLSNPDHYPTWAIQNLAADQSVVLQNLDIGEEYVFLFSGIDSLQIRDCAGTVWIDDVRLIGLGSFEDEAALHVVSSPAVVITHSSIFGSDSTGTVGLWVEASSFVSAFQSAFRGSLGEFDCIGHGPGAVAALIEGPMFASGCTFRGGQGLSKDTCFGFDPDASDGGDGVLVSGPAAVLDASDCTFEGGPPGGGSAVPGEPFEVIGGGVLNTLPGPARGMISSSPVYEGQPVELTVFGEEDDIVVALVSFEEPAFSDFTALVGPVVLAPPYTIVRLGALPSSGGHTFELDESSLPPSAQAVVAFVQGVFVTRSPEIFAGAPTALTILAAEFDL